MSDQSNTIIRKDTTTEPITLDLIRANGREIICDQDGRPVDNVRDIKYEVLNDDLAGQLTLTLTIKNPKWDVDLGRSVLGLKSEK